PRLVATPSLLVFPSTTIVEHPDFVSILVAHPRGHDETEFEHVMLVPADRVGDTEHWTRNWKLIDGQVFQAEDQWICEQIHRGIEAGTTDHLLFGGLEHAIAWFHEALAARTAT
ncbi:MAG TPA: SRPBCC family protein, partial [Kofleriaceae bacterium]|nr:SRPBCC family protein [Kofleriaceae bacterium]